MDDEKAKQNKHTGAKRVVGTLELLAGREVLALCRYALEVIGVVLVAVADILIMRWRVPTSNNAPVPCLIGVREPG